LNSTLALISGLGLEALGLETPGLVNIPAYLLRLLCTLQLQGIGQICLFLHRCRDVDCVSSVSLCWLSFESFLSFAMATFCSVILCLSEFLFIGFSILVVSTSASG